MTGASRPERRDGSRGWAPFVVLLAALGAARAQAQDQPGAAVPAAGGPATIAARHLLPDQPSLAAATPHVAVGGDGTVAVAFAVGDALWCAVSRDGGQTFGPAGKVGESGRLERGLARGPQVAVTDGAIVIVAVCGEQLMGKDGNLLAWRSDDRGASWKGPIRVNDVEDAAREGLHALAAAPDGSLLCVWLDLRREGTELWGSFSSDAGASWDDNTSLYTSPEGSICECCHPAVTFDPVAGQALVLWRNKLGGHRDMYAMAVKRGEASNASRAQQLDGEHWELQACPMAGGGLAVSSSGAALAFWRRGTRLFAASPGQGETELGEGRETSAAAGPDGFQLVWTDASGQVLTAHGPDGSAPRGAESLGKGFNTWVAGAPDGRGPVIAVWEAGTSGSDNLRFALLARRATADKP